MQRFEAIARDMNAAMRGFQENGELMVGCIVLFARPQHVPDLEESGLAALATTVCSPLYASLRNVDSIL